MNQITTRVPDDIVASLDEAATKLRRTRAEIVRQALEYYLEDFEDIARSLEAIQDPTDSVLDWEEVRRGLLRQD